MNKKEDIHMSKYEDFNLDFELVEEPSETGIYTSQWDCISVWVTKLTTQATKHSCPPTDGCTNGTCSACHSYCGSACRRR